MVNLDKKNSPSVKAQDTASEIYSLNCGNSNGSEHLLDAVVSEVHSSAKQRSDDNVSCRTTMTNNSSHCRPNVELPYSQAQVLDQIKEELFGVPEYLAEAEAMSCSFLSGSSKDYSSTYSLNSSIYGSQISSSVVKGQDIKQSSCASTGYSKKPDEMCKTNRKRLKPGENHRPRPKDRQMIQDRVKELREIVPNGAKCSIDALLERTIKHMLFLQNVTRHADKLKQTGEPKLQIVSKDGGLLSKDNFEGGATWAYEVGSQAMVCPIIVEDLNQPRQMLVEMLCEERGLFLEIADVIRGLGLTILKGVMETRKDNIWAHFAVEANRDVTRMEIFVSLVHLLEKNAKNVIQPAKGISKEIP
ncbi:transcription factor LHW-like isoform X2 [Olea europaea var. sylvestris]|uniref:transcription factor LHW-like isoform X2 n=1 Tax=Olea europaea var. sylvestris TaxID=158386 RepID=UPI000C1D8461|nr:transcription factor LHW-like isoform X2 [Olea europaea var. sylvestris]